jgi:hypothetical protein
MRLGRRISVQICLPRSDTPTDRVEDAIKEVVKAKTVCGAQGRGGMRLSRLSSASLQN